MNTEERLPERLPRLEPGRTALLVIDMQNDFCHEDGFFSKAGHDTSTCLSAATRAASVIERVRSAGVTVVFTKSINPRPPQHRLQPRRFRSPRDSESFEQGVGGTRQFVPGTWGSELVGELIPEESDLVVEKRTYNVFYETDLEQFLRARGIDTLVFSGVTTNVCVETSARDAYVRDFDVLVLSDCTAAFKNEWDLHEASLRTLDLVFGVVASSHDFLSALGLDDAAQMTGGR